MQRVNRGGLGFPGGLGPKPEDGPITWRGKTVIMDERDDVTAEAMAELRVKRNLPGKIICIGLPSKDILMLESWKNQPKSIWDVET